VSECGPRAVGAPPGRAFFAELSEIARELYDRLEETVDASEDVANTLETISVKR
jgi:hypothetical protein